MNPTIAPQFSQACDRLRSIEWLSQVGRSTSVELPFKCRFVSDALDAKKMVERSEWEEWTLDKANELTAFLHSRYRNRYSGQWNKIVRTAKSFLKDELEPRVLPALAEVTPGSEDALHALRWDILHALMEAAYADCRPPQFFTHLVAVYEAGHMPVGWDASSSGTLLVY